VSGNAAPRARDWLVALRRYLVVAASGNLVWETAQAPLYTLWRTGAPREIAEAILHCALGDVAIAAVTILAALVLVGSSAWPNDRFGAVLAATLVFATGYTVYSEYVNTVVQHSWSYTSWMPTLPWLGTGLAPLAQWMVVPAFALVSARRRVYQ